MTSDEMRTIIREELMGTGVAAEFRELIAIEIGDSYLPREEWTQPDVYVPCEELEKIGTSEPLGLTKSAGIVDASWDEPITLAKSTRRPATLGEELGVVKTEIFEQDGERLIKAFNARGEIVDVRVLLEVA